VPITHAALLFGAALLAGALNAVAGGGSFISFPALIMAGIPPIQANATSTAALWPGTVASTGAYRSTFTPEIRRLLIPVVLIGAGGAFLGAMILLRTPQATFMGMVPWLLLCATLLFAFGQPLVKRLRARSSSWKHGERASTIASFALQLSIAVYIGFFGAGAGILLLAMLTLLGLENIHAMNGVKTLVTSCCNLVALALFIHAGVIVWPHALLMLTGAVIGGYAGAHYSMKLPQARLRQVVIATGSLMTAYFFLR
jgi:uncharacterized membrane protein YfcA